MPESLTRAQVERYRLACLSEMYARGETTLEQHEWYVEQVLKGEQPVNESRLPFMPDPDLIQVGGELK